MASPSDAITSRPRLRLWPGVAIVLLQWAGRFGLPAVDQDLAFYGVFAGIGRAAQSFGALDDARSITSKGVGFRYLIARRYGFVMGADVARGPEETAFYIQAGSTW